MNRQTHAISPHVGLFLITVTYTMHKHRHRHTHTDPTNSDCLVQALEDQFVHGGRVNETASERATVGSRDGHCHSYTAVAQNRCVQQNCDSEDLSKRREHHFCAGSPTNYKFLSPKSCCLAT